MSTATAIVTTACTGCPNTTGDASDWAVRGPVAVASGVHLGTCPACLAGKARSVTAQETLPGLDLPA
ncbi:hypothetical protein [Ornithinimicrobium murale]|uniref:hypothetical protein n=1 Tax=Ornithinimicrobium murale TaxID=1050153 RepID=UPI000E0D0D1F|nr:hypothetical protein [Ornithinimicrobium murale]